MTTYKPGQVSSLLFANKKKVVNKDDNLAKLFSSPESAARVKIHTVSPSNQVLTVVPNNIKNNGSSSKPADQEKLREKKTCVKSPGRQVQEENKPADNKKQTKRETHRKSVRQTLEENPGKSSKFTVPFPYSHETLEQQKKEDVTPKKSLKPKLKNDKTDDNDWMAKRPRRDRHRDKQADKRTVFVGNCPLTADKKELKKLFREFGEIETVRFRCAPSADPSLPKRATVIMKNFHEQCSNFVSYIVFKEEEAAKKALVRNGYFLDGLHLRVDIAALSKKHDKKRSVFVGNLPFTISEEMIRSHFSDCGDITNIRIVRDRTTNLGKGICYVQFETKDSVGLALKLNKTEVQGRPIRVMVCTNKPKKKEDQSLKKVRHDDKVGKSKTRTMTFAPSNVTSSRFQTILKTKKERRFRKMKKKKENAKKQDGLSSIFGDIPAPSSKVIFQKTKKDSTGKYPVKSLGTKKNVNSFHRKGKGNSFNRNGKGTPFKGKGNSFKGKGKGTPFKGKGKTSRTKQ